MKESLPFHLKAAIWQSASSNAGMKWKSLIYKSADALRIICSVDHGILKPPSASIVTVSLRSGSVRQMQINSPLRPVHTNLANCPFADLTLRILVTISSLAEDER